MACASEALNAFAFEASNRENVVIMVKQNDDGKREVTGKYCCGIVTLGSHCSKCLRDLSTDRYSLDDAIMCEETWEDAVCCGAPVPTKHRSCKKCGKFFPTALELAERASVLAGCQFMMRKELKVINAHFFKFMKKCFPDDNYTYYGFLSCIARFNKENTSWKGFPVRLLFEENVQRTAMVLLTEGFEGLAKDPKSMFPESGDASRYARYFV